MRQAARHATSKYLSPVWQAEWQRLREAAARRTQGPPKRELLAGAHAEFTAAQAEVTRLEEAAGKVRTFCAAAVGRRLTIERELKAADEAPAGRLIARFTGAADVPAEATDLRNQKLNPASSRGESDGFASPSHGLHSAVVKAFAAEVKSETIVITPPGNSGNFSEIGTLHGAIHPARPVWSHRQA